MFFGIFILFVIIGGGASLLLDLIEGFIKLFLIGVVVVVFLALIIH